MLTFSTIFTVIFCCLFLCRAHSWLSQMVWAWRRWWRLTLAGCFSSPSVDTIIIITYSSYEVEMTAKIPLRKKGDNQHADWAVELMLSGTVAFVLSMSSVTNMQMHMAKANSSNDKIEYSNHHNSICLKFERWTSNSLNAPAVCEWRMKKTLCFCIA